MNVAQYLSNSSVNMNGMRDVSSRLFFVLMILLFYRLGTFIPIPGINTAILEEVAHSHAGGILGMFNMLTGGALSRLSIFALNIMPYITASIIIQLMMVVSDDMASLKKDGEMGRKKINQYTRWLTVFLALFQSYAIAYGVEAMKSGALSVVYSPGVFFRLGAVLSLTGGTVLVMWLAEQINVRGLGNGSSLIIFAGIVSGLPGALVSMFEMARVGSLDILSIVFVCISVMCLVALVVFVERAQRKLSVHYPRRQMGNKVYGGDSSHLPLKINMAGVIPAIFASSLLLFPATISNFYISDKIDADSGYAIKELIFTHLSHGKPLYIILYTLIIVFFCFFYAGIVFNPEETAENLQKNGGVVLGRRPGKQTAEYLSFLLKRLSVLGAMYMSLICILPELLMSKMSLPFYLGGTSVLIIVNVVMDFYTQLQSQLLTLQYGAMMRRFKGERRGV
jgi:preprotein translocase subunit SecY